MGFFLPPPQDLEQDKMMVVNLNQQKAQEQCQTPLNALTRLQELDLTACGKLTDTSIGKVQGFLGWGKQLLGLTALLNGPADMIFSLANVPVKRSCIVPFGGSPNTIGGTSKMTSYEVELLVHLANLMFSFIPCKASKELQAWKQHIGCVSLL